MALGILAACAPAVARADSLDAVGRIAEAIIAVWAVFALPLLGMAVFAPPSSSGGRILVSVLLVLVWGPALIFTFAAEMVPLGLVFLAAAAAGLFRVWTSPEPDGIR